MRTLRRCLSQRVHRAGPQNLISSEYRLGEEHDGRETVKVASSVDDDAKQVTPVQWLLHHFCQPESRKLHFRYLLAALMRHLRPATQEIGTSMRG